MKTLRINYILKSVFIVICLGVAALAIWLLFLNKPYEKVIDDFFNSLNKYDSKELLLLEPEFMRTVEEQQFLDEMVEGLESQGIKYTDWEIIDVQNGSRSECNEIEDHIYDYLGKKVEIKKCYAIELSCDIKVANSDTKNSTKMQFVIIKIANKYYYYIGSLNN